MAAGTADLRSVRALEWALRSALAAVAVAAVVLASPRAGAGTPVGADVQAFVCRVKGDEDLSRPGGGPGGAHWNIGDIRCEARVAWGSEPPASVRVDLTFGQGDRQELVGRAFLVPPERPAADPLPPTSTAVFVVPSAKVAAGLKRGHRQPATGATVFAGRMALLVRPIDARGREGKPLTRRIEFEAAFGE